MLNPEIIVEGVVSTIKTITPLVTLLGADPAPPLRSRISGFLFLSGVENTLATTVYELQSPGILVCWAGTVGGKSVGFSGMEIWKHKIDIYLRAGNASSSPTPTGAGYMWWLLMTSPVNGGPNNIRSSNAIAGIPNLDIMETPSVSHRQDQNGLDYIIASCVFPELLDDPS